MTRLIEQMTADYLEDVLVRLAHHSSAIEGNTISLPETASIILHDTLPNSANISRREFYEVDNHQQVFEYIIYAVERNEKLTVPVVKDIHEKLMDRLHKGQFKKNENILKGTVFPTAPPEQVPQLMEQLIGNLNYRLENSHSEHDKLRVILEFHIQFEKIHPFSDGNGRTGRMVMNYSLLENNLAPLIIKKEEKDTYMQILGEAQTKEYPDDADIERFVDFAKPKIEEEEKSIIIFANQNSEKILKIQETKEEEERRLKKMQQRRDGKT